MKELAQILQIPVLEDRLYKIAILDFEQVDPDELQVGDYFVGLSEISDLDYSASIKRVGGLARVFKAIKVSADEVKIAENDYLTPRVWYRDDQGWFYYGINQNRFRYRHIFRAIYFPL